VTALAAPPAARWRFLVAAIALLVAFAAAFTALAQTFPPLTGRVVDQAKLLSPEQSAALEAKLAQLEQQSGHQMVVATVASLEDYPIEDYGYRLGRSWGIGYRKPESAVRRWLPEALRPHGFPGSFSEALQSDFCKGLPGYR
jgi:uncharacterized protein